jgi:hypothetical protein
MFPSHTRIYLFFHSMFYSLAICTLSRPLFYHYHTATVSLPASLLCSCTFFALTLSPPHVVSVHTLCIISPFLLYHNLFTPLTLPVSLYLCLCSHSPTLFLYLLFHTISSFKLYLASHYLALTHCDLPLFRTTPVSLTSHTISLLL